MHVDPAAAACAVPEPPGGVAGSRAPYEWSVCPGAAECASMSEVPHGTIITATAFTSLSLLHCELASEERVQYEVHLLTSGLLQCGWCVSPAALPFTGQEGVGDFPMSVAADGLRGLVWNLTPVAVPELRWSSGDVLSCYADLGTGAFNFALNGRHCYSASLPTRALLLRHGASLYKDRHSTDEMLQYTPALALEGGEACVVNLGEAPMRHPRPGYRSLCETYWCGAEERLSLAFTLSGQSGWSAGRVSASGVAPLHSSSAGTAAHSSSGVHAATWRSGSPANSVYVGAMTASGSSSNSSFGHQHPQFSAMLSSGMLSGSAGGSGSGSSAAAVITLGGMDVSSLLRCLGLQPPTGTPAGGVFRLYAVLEAWTEEPTRVVERCARLVSWLHADVNLRWKAFTLWLYLWITRFYVDLRDLAEWDVSADFERYVTPRQFPAETPAAVTAHLQEMWHALELFMPPASFALIPGMVLAILQHRLSGGEEGTVRLLSRITTDLVSIPSFRVAWVADTASFTSTLLNLFALYPLHKGDEEAFAETLRTRTPDDVITTAALGAPVFARQRAQWRGAAHVMATVVRDAACRGPLSVALVRLMQDRQLKSAAAVAHSGTDAATDVFLEAYPYTFASAYSPTVLAALTLAVAVALSELMPGLGDGEPPIAAASTAGSGATHESQDEEDEEEREAPVPRIVVEGCETRTGDASSGACLSAPAAWPGLQWRQLAMTWLPPARFFGRPLSGSADSSSSGEKLRSPPAPKDLIADRVGGSMRAVSAIIDAEEEQLAALFRGMGEGEGDDGRHPGDAAPLLAAPIFIPTPRRERATAAETAAQQQQLLAPPPGGVATPLSDLCALPPPPPYTPTSQSTQLPHRTSGDTPSTANQSPPQRHHDPVSAAQERGDGVPLHVEAPPPDPSDSTRTELWKALADSHLELRGGFTRLPATPAQLSSSAAAAAAMTADDYRGALDRALEERRDELFLVTVIALDTYVRGLFAKCAHLPSALYNAIVALQQHQQQEHQQEHTSRDATGAASTVAGHASSGVDSFGQTRYITDLLLLTLPLRDDAGSTALAKFCGVAGRIYGYYWARMAVFERCFCMPATDHSDDRQPQLACYRAAEVAEAPFAPPRAFLMLPAQLSNVFVDLWLLVGLVRGHNALLATTAPSLLRFFFDANMRRATANVFARDYLYQAVASVLGAGPADRLCVAQQLAELHRATMAEESVGGGDGGRLGFVARHFADLLAIVQRSPSERAPINVLSVLLQAPAHTLVPPPRTLDEKFGWLLLLQPQETATKACGVAGSGRRGGAAARASADELLLRMFAESTARYTAGALLFPLLSQCNALLSRFSERMPPPPRWADATRETIMSFHALCHALRKTLCAMNVVCHAIHLRETEALSSPPSHKPQGSSAAPAGTAARGSTNAAALAPVSHLFGFSRGQSAVLTPAECLSPSSPFTASSCSSSSSSVSSCAGEYGVEEAATARRREDAAALRMELMDVLVQCLVRLLKSPAVSNAPAAELSGGEGVAHRFNELQPAVVCDVKGTYVWREVGCTRVGLLAPIFSMLRLFLDACGCRPSTNPFLVAAAAELPTLTKLSLAALACTSWWTAQPHRDGSDTIAAAGAQFVPDVPEGVAVLQRHLLELEGYVSSSHSARPSDAAATQPSTRSATTHEAESESSRNRRTRRSDSASAAESRLEGKGERSTPTSSPSLPSSSLSTMRRGDHASPAHSRSPPPPRDADANEVEEEEEEGEVLVDSSTGADDAEPCLICLSHRNNVRMLPCRHECCRGCYRRYQRVEHARMVANDGSGHAWSAAPSPNVSRATSVSHAVSDTSTAASAGGLAAASAASYGRGGDDSRGAEGRGLMIVTGDTITATMVAQEMAAAESTAVRCFFCKETVESVQRIHRPKRKSEKRNR